MNENLKKFLEEASKNEELKARLAALTDKETAVEKAIEIAKEYGFTLTAEDFKPADDAELSLDELDQVAGGTIIEEIFRHGIYLEEKRYSVFDERTGKLVGRTAGKATAIELAELTGVSTDIVTYVYENNN